MSARAQRVRGRAMPRLYLRRIAQALLMVLGVPAFAASSSTTFSVHTQVRGNCLINSASDMAFGAYVPGSGVNIDRTSTIVIRCQSGISYGIGLSIGTGGGTMAARRLTSATVATPLEYNLYVSAARTQVWENPSTITTTANNQGGVGSGMGNPQRKFHTVYGRLPDSALNRNVMPANDFTSTITLTVNY